MVNVNEWKRHGNKERCGKRVRIQLHALVISPPKLGDSERRQEQVAKDWCLRNGRKLAEQTFADRGVSGWRGDNRREGALGALLKIARAGDTILIEDCDRWSRETPLDSLNALRDTVNRGVEVVFLKTNITVNRDNFNDPVVLFPNFFGSYLANAENEKRSYRIRQAMEGKRQQLAAGRLIFGRLPAWLTWSAKPKTEGRKPVPVADKVEAVRRVYKLCLEGKGVAAIALAMRDTPPITNCKRGNWNGYFVYRLLRDRAVLGEHTPSGTPSIYPDIIGEADFFRVAEKLKARKHQTVRARVANSNLFSGLARCSVCNHTLTRISASRRYIYLVCGGRLRHVEGCKCDFHTIDYTQFEQSFLSLLQESGLVHKLLSNDRDTSPVDDLKYKLANVPQRADQLIRALEESGSGDAGRIGKRMAVLEAEETELQHQIDAESAKAKAEVPARDAYDQFASELAQHAHEPEGRARIRNALRDFMDKIVVQLV
jgi:DNA invertase Pin-like site-specific DNA recombinase